MEQEEVDRLWLTALEGCNEVQRRRLAGVKAIQIGWGGISYVCDLAKMSPNTVRKGLNEVKSGSVEKSKRQRKKGGGRKKIRDKNPQLEKDLKRIMDDTTAGDPMRLLKWTHKSTYAITEVLKETGHSISEDTVGRMLKKEKYSLQANKKRYEGTSHPDRDAQFHYINDKAKEFLKKKQPVISVDTKKKELVGNFKNNGRVWRRKGEPEEVNVYDFPNLAKGKVIPYGAYDISLNKGFVNVGITSDTSEFAVESIRQWWKQLGSKHYPNAKELLITADSGGSNGYRNKGWKYFLHKLAKEAGFKITVLHFPPATSKWNKIEHRLFSFISQNWRGKPLISYQVIINFIKNTKTEHGLEIFARLDKKKYEKGLKFSNEEMEKINVKYHHFHPEWNYTIRPK
jgi:transposase